MSCMINFNEPSTREQLYLPIRLMNDELIAYENGFIPNVWEIEDTLNVIFREDESCLFCKSKQDGNKLCFYGTIGPISNALLNDLNDGIYDRLLSRYSIDVLPGFDGVWFKLTLDYYDCRDWLIKKTKVARKIHREYIEDFDEPRWWYK